MVEPSRQPVARHRVHRGWIGAARLALAVAATGCAGGGAPGDDERQQPVDILDAAFVAEDGQAIETGVDGAIFDEAGLDATLVEDAMLEAGLDAGGPEATDGDAGDDGASNADDASVSDGASLDAMTDATAVQDAAADAWLEAGAPPDDAASDASDPADGAAQDASDPADGGSVDASDDGGASADGGATNDGAAPACGDGAPPTVDLTGSWMSGAMSLVLTQTGATVTGTYSVPGGATGSITGSVSGDRACLDLIDASSSCPGSYYAEAVVLGATAAVDVVGSNCGGATMESGVVTRL